MSSFVYYYVNCGKKANKALIHSVLIIFLCQIIGQNKHEYKSIFSEFQEAKLEFVNQFLKMICDNHQDPKRPRKILFKIFKFVYFLAQYVFEESDLDRLENNISKMSLGNKNKKYTKINKKLSKQKDIPANSMDLVDESIVNENVENQPQENEENLNKEDVDDINQIFNTANEEGVNNGAQVNKFHLPMKILQSLKSNIQKFLQKTKYDMQLFSDYSDEIFIKFFVLIDNSENLDFFSDDLNETYEEIKLNEYKIDRNGIELDLKERFGDYSNYLVNKKQKYFNLLNEFFSFYDVLKKESVNVIQECENSLMYDEEEEFYDNDNKSNNNVTNNYKIEEKNIKNNAEQRKNNNSNSNDQNNISDNKRRAKDKRCIDNFIFLKIFYKFFIFILI